MYVAQVYTDISYKVYKKLKYFHSAKNHEKVMKIRSNNNK
jgi:ribosomal protein S26